MPPNSRSLPPVPTPSPWVGTLPKRPRRRGYKRGMRLTHRTRREATLPTELDHGQCKNWPWVKIRAAARLADVPMSLIKKAREGQILRPGIHFKKLRRGGSVAAGVVYNFSAIQADWPTISRILTAQKGRSGLLAKEWNDTDPENLPRSVSTPATTGRFNVNALNDRDLEFLCDLKDRRLM